MPRTRSGAERHVVQRAQVREQVEALEHHADLGAHLGQRLAAHHLLAVDAHLAALVVLEQVDAADQRRLARARRADHHDHLAVATSRSMPRSAWKPP